MYGKKFKTRKPVRDVPRDGLVLEIPGTKGGYTKSKITYKVPQGSSITERKLGNRFLFPGTRQPQLRPWLRTSRGAKQILAIRKKAKA